VVASIIWNTVETDSNQQGDKVCHNSVITKNGILCPSKIVEDKDKSGHGGCKEA